MVKEKIILGENCSFSADCQETGLNNNVIVCGGSGSGTDGELRHQGGPVQNE